MKPVFPELFITGKLTGNEQKKEILADALVAWGNCMAGATPPDNFGHGMVEVEKALGVLPTPDNLMEYSKNKSNFEEVK